MEKKVLVFASDMFLNFAHHYGLINKNIPWCSYLWKTETVLSHEIGETLIALSYCYRLEFRKYIEVVFPFIKDSKPNLILYVQIFAERSFRYHSPYRFLVISCFISELYLHRFYELRLENGFKEYVEPTVECFGVIYEKVLKHKFNTTEGWEQLQFLGTKFKPGYDCLKPMIDLEHPNHPTAIIQSFLTKYSKVNAKIFAKRLISEKIDDSSLQATSEKKRTKEPAKQEKSHKLNLHSRNVESRAIDKTLKGSKPLSAEQKASGSSNPLCSRDVNSKSTNKLLDSDNASKSSGPELSQGKASKSSCRYERRLC